MNSAKKGFLLETEKVFILRLAFDLAFGNEIARIACPWPMSQKCWQRTLFYPIRRAKAREKRRSQCEALNPHKESSLHI
jgi:hypothetical protein